jgi:DNA-binding response OmpR family regulator
LPDAAVLDVNLPGHSTSLELAEWLDGHGVPIIFLTGCESPVMHGRWQDHARARKPFDPNELEKLLRAALTNGKQDDR